jgi:hypothetical protein
VTIANGLNASLTQDLTNRASAALGVPVDGGIAVFPRFTKTGPPR